MRARPTTLIASSTSGDSPRARRASAGSVARSISRVSYPRSASASSVSSANNLEREGERGLPEMATARGWVGDALTGEVWHHVFAEALGLFEMRIAREDERSDPLIYVFLKPRSHDFTRPHDRRTHSDARLADPGPKVGTDDQ